MRAETPTGAHSVDGARPIARGHEPVRFLSVSRDGETVPATRAVAVETPVAIEIDGLGYAVLMATPLALADLVTGFLLTERLIASVAEIRDLEEAYVGEAIVVRVALEPGGRDRVAHRVRHRTSDSSCGLCGVENLEQALRPLPAVATPSRADDRALFRALDGIEHHQPLNHGTGAAHAAALCDTAGGIRCVREDVGRHNALDKLIGAMMRGGLGWDGGFALLTSRCSYELVEKAALAGCPMLATVSAPTSLAVARAVAARLELRTLARPDGFLRTPAP